MAFWVIALGSPIAIYALDFWEHALGAGLMLWAVVGALRVLRQEGAVWWMALAGALLGAAATMRTESFVVAFALVGGTCLTLLFRRRIVDAFAGGALAVVGFGVPWLANLALESDLGGHSRAARAAGEARSPISSGGAVVGAGDPGQGGTHHLVRSPRLRLPGRRTAGRYRGRGGDRRRRAPPEGRVPGGDLRAGGRGVGLPGRGRHRARVRVRRPGRVAPRHRCGRGSIGRDRARAFVLPVALVATAITWAFEITGGAGPQWGGRYLLVPTTLLTVLGVVALSSTPVPVGRFLVGLAIGVTAFGFVWLAYRSHGVDSFFDELAQQPEDVVISTNGFLVREGGPAYEDRRYLSIGRGSADLQGAVDVVDAAGLSTFAVLTLPRSFRRCRGQRSAAPFRCPSLGSALVPPLRDHRARRPSDGFGVDIGRRRPRTRHTSGHAPDFAVDAPGTALGGALRFLVPRRLPRLRLHRRSRRRSHRSRWWRRGHGRSPDRSRIRTPTATTRRWPGRGSRTKDSHPSRTIPCTSCCRRGRIVSAAEWDYGCCRSRGSWERLLHPPCWHRRPVVGTRLLPCGSPGSPVRSCSMPIWLSLTPSPRRWAEPCSPSPSGGEASACRAGHRSLP